LKKLQKIAVAIYPG